MVDYAFIALCMVGFAVFMYVVLDGFGLGVGILFSFMTEKEHQMSLKSIAPVWDGNETWLVLGGALLYAAFPKACSVILPAIYLPLMVMLCALVGRGVAFEFRSKAVRTKDRWARCFFFSSLLATFCQGYLLGVFIHIGHEATTMSPGLLVMSPFVFLCGIGLCFGYALLGSGWLLIKMKGPFEEKVRGLAIQLYVSVLIILTAILIVTPIVVPRIGYLWMQTGALAKMAYMAVSFFVALYAFWRTVQGSEYWPFLGAVWIFFTSYLVLGYSLYPNLLPNKNYHVLAAHPSALFIVVWAGLFLLPILISYSVYAYWVFWGKVDSDASFYE